MSSRVLALAILLFWGLEAHAQALFDDQRTGIQVQGFAPDYTLEYLLQSDGWRNHETTTAE